MFSDKLINKILENGFGALTKSELDIYFLYLWIEDGQFINEKGELEDHEISLALNMTGAKVRNLIYEVDLKYRQAPDFINALIGEDRNIVTNIAGTTRDSIDTKYNRFGYDFNLVDTAGIRKKSKVKEDLEFYSVMRAVRTIEYSDVVILMVDATRGFESQDQNIFWLADKNRKGVIILINKWDLVEKETNTMRDFEAEIRRQIAPFTDVPIIFTSVLTKQRLLKAIETAVEVFENRKRRISTSKLNETMLEIVQQNSPPATKGKFVKIKYCMQLPTQTPQFAFFSNLPQYVKEPYKRYVENQLREHYNFSGVPITIYFRQK